MKLPAVHSITRKLCISLLGGFLLLFLLFHMVANLFILRHDDGAWYSAFCHFMGSNWVVKLTEVVLLGVLLLHIVLTLWLAVANRRARPVRYHQRQRSKTHGGSKLMVWTGILIFVCLWLHFADFYFVKIGWVKGEYMVRREQVEQGAVKELAQAAAQYGITPAEYLDAVEGQMTAYLEQLPIEQQVQMRAEVEALREVLPVAELIKEENLSADGQWVRHIGYEQKRLIEQEVEGCDVEPDFYFMTREKFSHFHIAFSYLLFFLVLFFHLRHAFPSAFQTLGLNNYKYNRAIEWCGKAYTWLVCLGFTAVVVLVYLGV
ncbi:MAG: hypothetical protein IJU19_07325 [Bacteroidales bacterium]|nr:hypothetical protein [Bacteroidales bacterium]